MFIAGGNSAEQPPIIVRTLKTHELLTHALRGNNGEKYGITVQDGYSHFEEGLGMYRGAAADGYIKPGVIYSYIFSALASGVGGQEYSRGELFDIMQNAELIYRQACPYLGSTSPEAIEAAAAIRVNRLFKGDRGEGGRMKNKLFSHMMLCIAVDSSALRRG